MAAPPIPEETVHGVITERAANVIVSQPVGAASRCRYSCLSDTDSNKVRPAANCVGFATPAAKRRKLHASSAADEVLGKAILLELKIRRLNSVIQEAL